MSSGSLLATGIVILIVGVFALGLTVDMFEQARTHHAWVPPDYLLEISKTIIQAAVGATVLGGTALYRKHKKWEGDGFDPEDSISGGFDSRERVDAARKRIERKKAAPVETSPKTGSDS